MINIKPVNAENVWKICNLKVTVEQENFVADNKDSIVEAYATIASGGAALPFGIYDGEIPVGFLMVGYGDIGEGEISGVLGPAYSVWRFMIDARYQGRGYGKSALKVALDYISTFPKGPAEYVYLSYVPENTGAAVLYHSFGFTETGDTDGDELIAIRKISE